MKILNIMGKSGSGKSTLINQLIEEFPNTFHYVRSYTTRPVRQEDYDNDIKTHTFVDDNFWKENQESAIAVYFGQDYVSWTDESSFDPDKINIYAIDPMAFVGDMQEWSQGNLDVEVYGLYLKICDNERQKRWHARHQKMNGFKMENHLDSEILKDSGMCYEILELGEERLSNRGPISTLVYHPMSREDAYEAFKYNIELIGGIKL